MPSRKSVGAVITTYASARLHLDKIPEDRFQMLVLDEAHKLRNLYGVDPPPQVAVRFKKALEERRFRYVLMLTATPIQNRLWDLYSLVDLLTVARGHQNPFGSEGMFARKFIADKRDTARQLKPEAREEFRSIVYGYMSRVRRGDAKLYFPDRVVQLHRVDPTPAELELIRVIAKPIQKLNRLAQICILQALTSSPHALMAQLTNMARNGTVPQDLAAAVCSIVGRMKTSAKLKGLGTLIDQLMRKNPERWRMVVFTGRIETQTTIQAFLEERGLKVGIINGTSGQRNQETISAFLEEPARLSRDRLDRSGIGRRQSSGRQCAGELRPALEPDDRRAAHRAHPEARLRTCERQHPQHHPEGHLRGIHRRPADGEAADGRARHRRHRGAAGSLRH